MLCYEAFRYSQSLSTELHIYVHTPKCLHDFCFTCFFTAFFAPFLLLVSGHWLLGWLVKIFLVESLCKCGMIRFS